MTGTERARLLAPLLCLRPKMGCCYCVCSICICIFVFVVLYLYFCIYILYLYFCICICNEQRGLACATSLPPTKVKHGMVLLLLYLHWYIFCNCIWICTIVLFLILSHGFRGCAPPTATVFVNILLATQLL